jgi:pre-rRNA-processing protein TSR1
MKVVASRKAPPISQKIFLRKIQKFLTPPSLLCLSTATQCLPRDHVFAVPNQRRRLVTMSLPFRTKGGDSGGTMTMAAAVHHHRSTTKADHKPFKTKFASKGALKDAAKGKVSSSGEDRGKRRTPYQQTMSKLARKNQAKQLRNNHKDRQEDESRIFHGIGGAPKHVAIVPLAPDVDVEATIKALTGGSGTVEPQSNGTTYLMVERFRRNLLFLPAKFDPLNAMDICKLADWVLFVLTPDQRYDEDVDMLLKATEGQGITSFAAVVQNLNDSVPAQKRSRHLIELRMDLGHYLPSIDKLSSLDSESDCSNLIRTLCTASTKGIKWRDDRSWMLVDGYEWRPSADGQPSDAVISGIVRGKPLNPDRLVQLSGYGDLRIGSVRQLPSKQMKRKADEMSVEESLAEWGPSEKQDSLETYAPEEAEMTDAAEMENGSEEKKGVLLDDHHYFSDDNSHIPARPKKLPTGTSDYQSAWYLEDVSDSDDDDYDLDEQGDVDMDSGALSKPEDGFVADAATEAAPTEYPESEMHVDADDEEEARQLSEYRSRKKEVEEDLEFPDEIELHPNVSARERLAKYRGLKSLRDSEWNTAEDKAYEPDTFSRLLHISDHKKSTNTAKKEALTGPIPAGSRVEITLLDVPQPTAPPTSLFSLLRHEHKHSAINLSMTLSSSATAPVRSKDPLLVQIGHRRLIINPVFSASGTTPNDVHKFMRFLHPGTTATATFVGPVTWGSTPCLVFRHRDASTPISSSTPPEELDLIGSATTLPPSTSRVIAKRVILTGHPFKIHKKLVTIRYMFFNREDVEWFKALPLWTKRGRQGFIKEALGTHGYFKATFDGKINPMDGVGVSLYKRCWPRDCVVLQ